jgi:hypothetical protein
MRNTTTITVTTLILASLAAQVTGQPGPPFGATMDFTVTYPNFPQASGVYTFAFVTDHYVHDGLPTTFGTIDWAGPYTPQTTTGGFVHAQEGRFIRFTGTWFNDGFLVTFVAHPTATITGSLVPEPAALSIFGLAPLLFRRRA